MKKRPYAIKIAAFFLILFIIVNLLSEIFMPDNTVGGIKGEPDDSLDYIAIGDSECFSTISPLELWKDYGYCGYNYGISAQRIQDSYYQLKKALKHQSPKVILMETNMFYRTQGTIQELQDMLNHFTAVAFPIFRYHDEWKRLIFHQSDTPISTDQNVIFKGMNYVTKANPYEGGAYANETDEIQKIRPLQLMYLNKIVRLCRQKDIQLILYCVPSPICWSYAKHNAVEKYAEANGLPFIDLNLKTDELGIDWTTDSYDKGDHLNFTGALKITAYIGTYFSQNTSLPDRRGDSRYSDAWNEALKVYENYLQPNSN